MKKILFQGDSITDAGRFRDYHDPFNRLGCGYPSLIAGRMDLAHPGEYAWVNRGVGGDRIVDIYARMQRDLLNHAPDCLSILVGVNDVWHGLEAQPNGVSAAKFEKVYDLLLEEVRDALPAIRIILLGAFVLPGGATVRADQPQRWETFAREVAVRDQIARKLAEKHGCLYVPLQPQFDACCEKMPPEYWLFDGVHPTEAGHELIAQAWIKAFEQIEWPE